MTFNGQRTAFSFGADFLGEVGVGGFISPVGKNYVYGVGLSAGLGIAPEIVGGQVNFGTTKIKK